MTRKDISSNQTIILLSTIHKYLPFLIVDSNSYYIIVKAIEIFNKYPYNHGINPSIDFIYIFIFQNFLSICYNNQGCCALQKIIDHSNIYYKQQIYNMVLYNTLYLIENIQGNYVLGYIISLKNNMINKEIANKIFENDFKVYLIRKHSSYIVNLLIVNSTSEIRGFIIRKIVNLNLLKILLKNEYGCLSKYYLYIHCIFMKSC